MLWLLVLTVCFFGSVTAYSTGAPDKRCNNMLPEPNSTYGHGADPQAVAPPYTVTVNKTASNDRFSVSLKANAGVTFKGFLIEARNLSGLPIGTWDTPTSADSKLMKCGVTHNKTNPRTEEKLMWTAPANYTGILVVKATVVYNKTTYWTDVKADTLFFGPNGKVAATQASISVLLLSLVAIAFGRAF